MTSPLKSISIPSSFVPTMPPLAISPLEDAPLSREKMVLDGADQETICEHWKNPLNFERGECRFSWSLYTFLSYVTPYFTGKVVKAKMEMIQGCEPAVTESFL